jgi:hypothetical protein
MLFWNKRDLSRKLDQYKEFYNETRGHLSLKGKTPKQAGEKTTRAIIPVDNYTWASNCNGLINTPIACSTKNSHGTPSPPVGLISALHLLCVFFLSCLLFVEA